MLPSLPARGRSSGGLRTGARGHRRRCRGALAIRHHPARDGPAGRAAGLDGAKPRGHGRGAYLHGRAALQRPTGGSTDTVSSSRGAPRRQQSSSRSRTASGSADSSATPFGTWVTGAWRAPSSPSGTVRSGSGRLWPASPRPSGSSARGRQRPRRPPKVAPARCRAHAHRSPRGRGSRTSPRRPSIPISPAWPRAVDTLSDELDVCFCFSDSPAAHGVRSGPSKGIESTSAKVPAGSRVFTGMGARSTGVHGPRADRGHLRPRTLRQRSPSRHGGACRCDVSNGALTAGRPRDARKRPLSGQRGGTGREVFTIPLGYDANNVKQIPDSEPRSYNETQPG